ncbi:Fpg/Nei family DNA glycosylase [Segetibacter sp. 3557_3]|uniref:DNA-formamidopyrimidine glycosylase family protein n=1 Tax=Segetibacter sp. 3557_3 TaxID=2547429 RepID=UPI0010587286|nr:DNA-formamidopyrimidine glycosylase family protein [Segetibacter sp. 3557_3]TDH26996.1 Fpg/Nei family DNA glycosylase [Segetibacter sp. 3557_3]
MPEIPDIEVFSSNIKSRFSGKVLTKVTVINGNKLQDTQEALSASLEGKTLEDVFRSGKELRYQFSNGTMLGMHLMLTGDMFPFEQTNKNKFTIVELHFDDGSGIALTDRMRNANVKLNPVDKDGIDALDKALDFKYLKKLLSRKTAIKNILLDQNLIRGIGNGYSDEILWETKISPFSHADAIPDEKIRELAKAIKKVLTSATEKIKKAYPGLITGEIKEFLKIHNRKVKESPTRYPVKIVTNGSRKTFYTDEQVLYT